MKFLADENVPLDAVRALRSAGLDVASASEKMAGAADIDLLRLANIDHRVVVTFDKDFAELVFRAQEQATGVTLLRTRLGITN